MLILRKTQQILLRNTLRSTIVQREFSKDDDASSSDDEKENKAKNIPKKSKAPPQQAEETAADRLNRLLASMKTAENTQFKERPQSSDISMARPGEAHRKQKENLKKEADNKDILVAVKRVADLLGEDNKKTTESELLAKLLGHDNNNATESGKKQTKTNESGELSLSDLIVGMKIDRKPKAEETRSDYVRRTIAAKTQQQQRGGENRYSRTQHKREAAAYTGSVNLFNCEPLGIFKDPSTLQDSPDLLPTWASLYEHDLKLAITHPPANYFEKVARWTEQGKVWRFPINNEQDMIDEVNVDFSEHIFLEQHLEGWCPDKGPIRHFMELVCVGLSKNPFITAVEKKEHILWYRDYFESKKELLKEYLGRDGGTAKVTSGSTQIEN